MAPCSRVENRAPDFERLRQSAGNGDPLDICALHRRRGEARRGAHIDRDMASETANVVYRDRAAATNEHIPVRRQIIRDARQPMRHRLGKDDTPSLLFARKGKEHRRVEKSIFLFFRDEAAKLNGISDTQFARELS